MKGLVRHGNKWRIDTRTGGERLRSPSFSNRAEAVRWGELHGLVAGVVGGRRAVGATVADALEYYARHRSAPRHHVIRLERAFGDLMAIDLRQGHVDDYLRGRGASPKTAWNELVTLRSALRYAWRDDVVTEPPRFTLGRPASVRETVCWPEQMAKVLEAADLPLRRVLLACYCCGLRRGEAVGARWQWVQGDVLTIPKTKNGRPKSVTLPTELLDLLRLAPRHPEWLFAKWSSRNGKAPFSPGRYHPSTVQREWRRCREAAGVPGLRLHDLRRSMASVALSRGHVQAAVQRAGGWRDVGTMQRHYAHAQQGAAAEVARDLIGAVAPRLKLMQGGQG